MITSLLFRLGWNTVGRLPDSIARMIFAIGANIAWLIHGKSVRRLETNLMRVRPQATHREIRRLSRQGMRSYMRYYCEVFQLGSLTLDQIDARVRIVDGEKPMEYLSQGKSALAFLGHMGNWDLAGAYATRNIAPTTTVAEKLNPPDLFEDYLRLRTHIGLSIIALEPHAPGGAAFKELLQAVRTGSTLIPLLADRDLTDRGVEVTFFGEKARMAAGPASLAVSGSSPLFAVAIWHERLSSEARKIAGSPWGIAVQFSPELIPTPGLSTRETVEDLTQQAASYLQRGIEEHPQDWHMLQRVFINDLDPNYKQAKTQGGDSS